jgi:spore coat polysaccharide biosynthesis protein SpsF
VNTIKTIVIIQARMGSTRLPGKVLLPLGESVVLNYVVTRCKSISPVDEVIVATSDLPGDNPIAVWCERNNVNYFRGAEHDVLARFYECAQLYRPDYIIRVTADCPFLDISLANESIRLISEHPADMVVLNGVLPRGLATELISYSALEKIHKISTAERHREHVTFYAYEYPEQFSQTELKIPEALQYPQLRITLDMAEDYALCQAIADNYPGSLLAPADEIVAYLLEHPEVAHLNAHIEQKKVK